MTTHIIIGLDSKKEGEREKNIIILPAYDNDDDDDEKSFIEWYWCYKLQISSCQKKNNIKDFWGQIKPKNLFYLKVNKVRYFDIYY
mgnify:CR=1 FL=1